MQRPWGSYEYHVFSVEAPHAKRMGRSYVSSVVALRWHLPSSSQDIVHNKFPWRPHLPGEDRERDQLQTLPGHLHSHRTPHSSAQPHTLH